ncbi:hypothetical protein DVH24_038638 [Malus domestica]|uniref:SNF2 N-terminal domain-containing protein n=1 Tax=Malus domestica TaxID=3750 RepID=A0A498KDC4_MALDO|nr:hypothetical protein DVH24_038638 [Malus domestica]
MAIPVGNRALVYAGVYEDVLQKLQRLTRTIANHPLLVRRIYSDEDVKVTLDKVVGELKNYSDFSIHRALAELLPSLKLAGHGVLIFSQWTSMLDILEWTLRLDGRYWCTFITFTYCSYHKKMCHATWYICFILWLAQFHLLIVHSGDRMTDDN